MKPGACFASDGNAAELMYGRCVLQKGSLDGFHKIERKRVYVYTERNVERLRKSIAGEKTDGHAVFNFYTYPFFHAATNVPLNEYSIILSFAFSLSRKRWRCWTAVVTWFLIWVRLAECGALDGKVRFGRHGRHGFISVEPAEIEDLDDVLAISVGYLMSNGPRPFLLVQ